MPEKRQYLKIMALTGPHGIRGMVKARILSEHPERLPGLTEGWLMDSDELNPELVSLTVQLHQNMALVHIAGITDRDQAEELRGKFVALDRQQAGEPPEGRYYVSDLIGCRVLDQIGNLIGELNDVLDGPGYDLWQIRRKAGQPVILPLVNDTLIDVSDDLSTARVKLPDGLLAIYDEGES